MPPEVRRGQPTFHCTYRPRPGKYPAEATCLALSTPTPCSWPSCPPRPQSRPRWFQAPAEALSAFMASLEVLPGEFTATEPLLPHDPVFLISPGLWVGREAGRPRGSSEIVT